MSSISPSNEDNYRPRVPRSSYSLSNAQRWLKYFDDAIETKSNVKITPTPGDPEKLAISTIKNRVADGLKWLAENDIVEFLPNSIHKFTDYVELKRCLKICNRLDYVELVYNHSRFRRPVLIATTVDASSLDNFDSLREEIVNFLQDEKQPGPFYRGNLELDEEFVAWCRRTCAGLEYDITRNKVTIVK